MFVENEMPGSATGTDCLPSSDQCLRREQSAECEFSVIIPVYNVDVALFRECLGSIERQSFEDYELIVVDDGSLPDLAERYRTVCQDMGCSCTYLRQENSGPYAARLAGVQAARGRYVIFVDGDDALRDDALFVLRCRIEATPLSDVVVFKLTKDSTFCEDGATDYFSIDPLGGDGSIDMSVARDYLLTTDRLNSVYLKAARRNLFLGAPSYEGVRLIMGEDKLLCAFLFDRAKEVVFLDEALYYYRTNPLGTINSGFSMQRFDNLCFVFDEMKKWAVRWKKMALLPSMASLFVSQVAIELFSLAQSRLSRSDKRAAFQSIGKNILFREAFRAMDSGAISKFRRAVARCAFYDRYHSFSVLCEVRNLIRRA